jgi:metallo-beta-lactamase family protein
MAINATDILCKFKQEHRLDEEACAKLCKVATYVNTAEESKELDRKNTPQIIIAASGMAEGGRVLHHLKEFGPDPKNTILFTGYQAGGSRGARILNGEPEVKIYGEMVPILAHVETITSTSAHSDYQELLDWCSHFSHPPKKVFITHGEPEAAHSLEQKLREQLGWNCVVPDYQQTETLE